MSSALPAVARIRLQRSLGEAEDRIRTARRVALASGAVVAACTLFLIADYGVGVWQGARATARIEALEGQTKEDPEVAAQLHEERERHTQATLARETRGRALAWALLFAGGTFVAAGKWWVSLQPERRPSLEELVAIRFGTGVAGTGGKQEVQKPGTQRQGAQERHTTPATRDAAPEAFDLEFVDDLVQRFGRGQEHAIPILQAIQSHYRYLPDEALRRVCELTEITAAQIAGTSSFYSQFRRSPVGRHVVRVCHGTACHVAGAEQITEELRRHLDIPADADTDPERLFTLDKVACLGCCSLAPVMMIEDETAGRLTPATARQALDAVERKS